MDTSNLKMEFSDQLFSTSKHFENLPTMNIAVLYNKPNINSDTQIELDIVDLSYTDFLNIFYHSPGGAFSMNPNAKYFAPLQMNNFTYTSGENSKTKWNLKHQLLKAYSKKMKVGENQISSRIQIQLQRESFLLNSIAAHNGYQEAISLDELFNTMTNTGYIDFTGNLEDITKVLIKLTYQYYSPSLDLAISAILQFRVKIPKFKMLNSNEDHVTFEYSKHEIEPELIKNEEGIDYYEDDHTIRTIGTKNLIHTLFEDNEDVLLDEDTQFRNTKVW